MTPLLRDRVCPLGPASPSEASSGGRDSETPLPVKAVPETSLQCLFVKSQLLPLETIPVRETQPVSSRLLVTSHQPSVFRLTHIVGSLSSH